MKPSRFTDLIDTINSAPIGPEQKTAAPNASVWANCGLTCPEVILGDDRCSDARALASAGSQAERRRGPEFIIPPTKVGLNFYQQQRSHLSLAAGHPLPCRPDYWWRVLHSRARQRSAAPAEPLRPTCSESGPSPAAGYDRAGGDRMRTPSRLPRCGTQARAVHPSKHELIRLSYLTRLHAAVPTFMASGVCWCRKARTAVQMARTGQKKKPSSRICSPYRFHLQSQKQRWLRGRL